jgi:hypothetical protein
VPPVLALPLPRVLHQISTSRVQTLSVRFVVGLVLGLCFASTTCLFCARADGVLRSQRQRAARLLQCLRSLWER